jgi:arsenite/tail-anchored protein-transporting ATPase
MFSPYCRLVQTMDYSVVVFDTAPTGHTLRLLQFPATLEKGLEKVMELKNRFGGVLDQVLFIHFRVVENYSFYQSC